MSKEVVLLDDDSDGNDNDVQEIIAPISFSNNVVDLTSSAIGGGASQRRRHSTQNQNTTRSGEVQFVGTKASAGGGKQSNSNGAAFNSTANNNDIVQFAGVKRPRQQRHANGTGGRNNDTGGFNGMTYNGGGGYNAASAASATTHRQNSNNNQFAAAGAAYGGGGGRGAHNYHHHNVASAAAASSRNQFINSNNNMFPDTNSGGIMGGTGSNLARNFGLGRGRGRGSGGPTSYLDQLLSMANNAMGWGRGGGNNNNYHYRGGAHGYGQKKQKKSPTKAAKPKEHEPTAMEKGKTLQKPQGYDAIDLYYPHLKANDRTLILHKLLLNSSSSSTNYYTKKFVHDYRVKYEKTHVKATVWSLAKGLSEEIIKLQLQADGDDDTKMPAKITGVKNSSGSSNQKENKPNKEEGLKSSGSDTEEVVDITEKKTKSIGTISGNTFDTLQTYFNAHVNKAKHKSMLDNIEPTQSQNGLVCSICADNFDASDIVACSGVDDIHFFCKGCLHSYCTLTVQSGPVQTMTCPLPNCKSLFATQDIKSTLSSWDLLMIQHREESRDRRVALAAEAMLHCECGMVAVITKEDMGDGRIACPGDGCNRRYCGKCGNVDHGKESCPPPAETVQWLSKHSKPCPNCKNPIEKNGGCDHMTCRPPVGCGYEFYYSCGCKFPGPHTCRR